MHCDHPEGRRDGAECNNIGNFVAR